MAERLFHVGVKALVTNKAGEVLLVGRHGRQQGKAHLDFPGGRMEAGEDLPDALARELREEIGVSFKGSPQHFATVRATITVPTAEAGEVGLLLIVYSTELEAGKQFVLGDDEEIIQWLSPVAAAEALKFKYPPEFCATVAALA